MFKWPRMEGVVESLTKKNVIYPLLIGFFFSMIIVCIVFSFTKNIILQIFSLLMPLGFVFQILRSYQYFSIHNPDMLRTETHIIKRKVLEIIGDDKNPLNESKTAAIISTINFNNPINFKDSIDTNNESLKIQEKND